LQLTTYVLYVDQCRGFQPDVHDPCGGREPFVEGRKWGLVKHANCNWTTNVMHRPV